MHARTHQTIPPLSEGRREEGGGSKDPDGFGPIRAPNLFRFIAFLIHKFLFNLICRHCYGNTAWKRCISSASSFSQPSLFYSSLSLSLSFLVFFVPLLLSRGSSWTFLIPFLYFSFLFFSLDFWRRGRGYSFCKISIDDRLFFVYMYIYKIVWIILLFKKSFFHRICRIIIRVDLLK